MDRNDPETDCKRCFHVPDLQCLVFTESQEAFKDPYDTKI